MTFFKEHYNNPYSDEPFIFQQSWLTDEEIDRIREHGDSLESTSVKLYGHYTEDNVKASGSHFLLNDQTEWLYTKMFELAKSINSESYQYDITGFAENFYYLKYTAPGEHFNWHIDIGGRTPAPRKLSLVLQLSSPDEYEGGDFNVMVASHHVTAPKKKGLIVAFPSYAIHRVTPVTKGVRRTLTMFTCGPNFR